MSERTPIESIQGLRAELDAQYKEYPNVPTMLSLQSEQINGTRCYVTDASGDPSITSGYGYYAFSGTATGSINDYTLLSKEETTNVDLSPYQTKTDNTLDTTDKTVVGAINEVHAALFEVAPVYVVETGGTYETLAQVDTDANSKGFEFVYIIYKSTTIAANDSLDNISAEIKFINPIANSSSVVIYLNADQLYYDIIGLNDINDRVTVTCYRNSIVNFYDCYIASIVSTFEDNKTMNINLYNTVTLLWDANAIVSAVNRVLNLTINGTSEIKGLVSPYTFCTRFDMFGGSVNMSSAFSILGTAGSNIYGGYFIGSTTYDSDGDLNVYGGYYTGLTSNTGTGVINDYRPGAGVNSYPSGDALFLTPSTTSNDGDSTGISMPNTPIGAVMFEVNGIPYEIGDADKSTPVYASTDGGTTALALASIVSGAIFYWNGTIAGFELNPTNHKVNIIHNKT